MPEITAAAVSALRSRTQAGLMDCKRALTESGGDEEAAIEWLRKKGLAKAAKLGDREMGEGRIFAAAAGGRGAMIQISCETDFVARNDDFAAMGKKAAELALARGEEARSEIETMIAQSAGLLGENMTLVRMELASGPEVAAYVHGTGKIGVLTVLSTPGEEAARGVAMHVAAMNPAYVHPDHVPAADVERERPIWMEEVSKKPEQIQASILAGKEKKFREESALICQPYVLSQDQSVAAAIKPAEVVAFVRFAI